MSQDEISLNIDKFVHPPRTLYDEIGQGEQDAYITAKSAQKNSDVDWQHIVECLQDENASLVHSLKEINTHLMQSRREKEELEKFIQRQTKTTDKIVSRLKNQKESTNEEAKKDSQILDLIFQKDYILKENRALKESQQEIQNYYGIKLNTNDSNLLFKWRSCVYALIALERFKYGLKRK
ncbi:unnamed protein product [Mucor hiemalis]